ncbi:hypothetical protein [Amycolatopsis benzoatilytica]|uniref:hypothetical protein n=1 Tax=Amycolatopsis benzoatilytica TaxID=346045 RepID=UPI0012B6889C|nr:hypothetical protein [Amycolatopsis benzoatilytica]
MGLFGHAAGAIVRFDVAACPNFDHYLPNGGRRPLGRCRTAVQLGNVAGVAIALFGLGTIGVTAGLGLAGGIAGGTGLLLLATMWFTPGVRWEWMAADSVLPGMWVLAPAPKAFAEPGEFRIHGTVQVTQIAATFVHHGKAHCRRVGYVSGSHGEFLPFEKLVVFKLTDPMARFRKPKPVKSQFEELEPLVTAFLRMLWKDRPGLSAEDCLTKLGRAGWPEDLARRAMDAAARLGMIGLDAKRLTLTGAGKVWLLSSERRRGIELIPDAEERRPMTINNDGVMQFGDHNVGFVARDSGTASNVHHSTEGVSKPELAALRQLLGVLRQPELRAQLNEHALVTVERETETIATAVEQNAPVTDAVRRAVTVILGVASQLIIGAAGNGLYDALKQMV